MSLMPSRIALVVALGLASPSFAARLITPQQAQATIAQNGFTPVGQPMLKGAVFGSLARLGNLSFIVTVDATTGQFLAAKPTGQAAAPAAVPTPPPVVNVTVQTAPPPAAPMAQAKAQPAVNRRYLPSYSAGAPKRVAISTTPNRPVKQRVNNVNIKALPKPSGFNPVLGPIYPAPGGGGGHFVVDPTLGAVLVDAGLVNAALAVQQGLLPPGVLGPGYGPSSGYQIGFADGFNAANLNGLPPLLGVDPMQGPIYRDPVTGGPMVFSPPGPDGVMWPVPYADPTQFQAINNNFNLINPNNLNVINSAPGPGGPEPVVVGPNPVPVGPTPTPVGSTPTPEANPQPTPTPAPAGPPPMPDPGAPDLTGRGLPLDMVRQIDPGIGSGHPLNSDQQAILANAIGLPTPPGGFTDAQKQTLNDISNHLAATPPQTPVNPTPAADPTQPQHMTDQQLASFLDTLDTSKPSALYTEIVANVAAKELGADPTIGTGQPLTDQQFDNVAHAMGMTTPPGGFTDAQKADLQTIADHIIPDAPQTLQNTAVNQAVQADPADVNAKVLGTVATMDPGAVDPNSMTAVATAQPGMVDPVALNTVLQTNPGDVAPDGLMQAGMANPGTLTPTTIDAVQQMSPGFDPNGIGQGAMDLQQQVDAAIATADQNQQPYMTFDSTQTADTTGAGDTTTTSAGDQPFMSFSAADFADQMPAADAASQAPDATGTGAADQGFTMNDFMGADAASGQTDTTGGGVAADQGFTMNDFTDVGNGGLVDTPASNAPADTGNLMNTPANNAPADNGLMNAPANNAPADNGLMNAPANNAPADNGFMNAPQNNGPADNGGGGFDNGGGGGGDAGGDGG